VYGAIYGSFAQYGFKWISSKGPFRFLIKIISIMHFKNAKYETVQ